jgi:hypothetical protein
MALLLPSLLLKRIPTLTTPLTPSFSHPLLHTKLPRSSICPSSSLSLSYRHYTTSPPSETTKEQAPKNPTSKIHVSFFFFFVSSLCNNHTSHTSHTSHSTHRKSHITRHRNTVAPVDFTHHPLCRLFITNYLDLKANEYNHKFIPYFSLFPPPGGMVAPFTLFFFFFFFFDLNRQATHFTQVYVPFHTHPRSKKVEKMLILHQVITK